MKTSALLEHIERLSDRERRVVAHLLSHRPITRDIAQDFIDQQSFGDRVADRVAAFGGSWRFILLFLGVMSVWMIFNIADTRRFDPYPFILLNLVLSCLAALQAPVIMMSQNRQVDKDRMDARHDYEVNLKAELEVAGLHVKVDELRQAQWQELILLQQRQMQLLEDIRSVLAGRDS